MHLYMTVARLVVKPKSNDGKMYSSALASFICGCTYHSVAVPMCKHICRVVMLTNEHVLSTSKSALVCVDLPVCKCSVDMPSFPCVCTYAYGMYVSCVYEPLCGHTCL